MAALRPGGRRAGARTAALAGTALLAAACGGGRSSGSQGGSGSGDSAAASATPASYQQTIAYSRCMRSHGAPTFPDPVQGPGGAWLYPMDPQLHQSLSGPGFSAAQNACQKLQPPGGITPAERQAAINQLLALARCMRAHGIASFPDPDVSGHGIGINLGNAGIDPNSPQFQTAQQACHMPGLTGGASK